LSDLRAKKAHFVESFLALEKHNDILTVSSAYDVNSIKFNIEDQRFCVVSDSPENT
jgi:hypothetical protein